MIGDVLNALQTHGKPVKRNRDGYQACCPAHDDSSPSLTIAEGAKGGVVLKCFAGCELDAVLGAIGLDREAVRPPREEKADSDRWTPHGPALDIYRYTDEDGELLFEVVRCEGKRFLQRRPDRSTRSGWDWKLGDTRRPLYRLPRVLKGISDGVPIFVCEGEKDVRALEKAGQVATCNPGGAGKWLPAHTTILKDADVIIVADRDDTGRKHARDVARALEGVARGVTRVEPVEGKDAFDHLLAGHTADEFLVVSEGEEALEFGPDLLTFLTSTDAPYAWVVKGLVEKGDRLMITGYEGHGKSQLLWQIAICVAAGIHPLNMVPVPRRRVLLVDCENGTRHLRRKLRVLHDLAVSTGHPVESGMMHVLSRPRGLDLTLAEDAAWLHERCVAHKPELLILGPLYRMHSQDENDTRAARMVQDAIDAARDVNESVMILEAHCGHTRIDGARALRPRGAAAWMGWSQFGYGLSPKGGGRYDFLNWRGPRDERAWPDEVHRGSLWPFEGKWDRPQDDGLF